MYQPEINAGMRKTLILWLIEVHYTHGLRPETLYLAVNILDRLSSALILSRSMYQLVGITSLWLAAKYEENHGRVPSLRRLVATCANAYTESDLIKMEKQIFSSLNGFLESPGAESFLRSECQIRGIGGQGNGARLRCVARYLLECTLCNVDSILIRPSRMAMGALLVADMALGTGYISRNDSFNDTINIILDSISEPPKFIMQKYSSDHFHFASVHIQRWRAKAYVIFLFPLVLFSLTFFWFSVLIPFFFFFFFFVYCESTSTSSTSIIFTVLF